MERQIRGLYFEVEVKQTVDGWLGGLALGFTHTAPQQFQHERVPDKAWRVPSTFVVGYSGCIYLDGTERRTEWQPDVLKVGQRVGLLLTGDGRCDMVVYVDGEEVSPATSTMASFEEVASGVEVKRQELVDLATATEKSGCQLSRSSGSLSEEPQATSSC